MRNIKRFLKRQLAEFRLSPRRQTLQQEVSRALGCEVRLQLSGARGHDSVYYAVESNRRLGVLRVLNPYLQRGNPQREMPFVSLEPRARLAHEWDVYQSLYPRGLSPKPLWHAPDALLCSYVDAPRYSEQFEANPLILSVLASSAAKGIHQMHEAGVLHMDVCFANVLGSPNTSTIWIDFEYGPSPGLPPGTAQAYDYLRLIESSLKFLSPSQRSQPFLWREALEPHVGIPCRTADLAPLRPALTRLLRDSPLMAELKKIFLGLDRP